MNRVLFVGAERLYNRLSHTGKMNTMSKNQDQQSQNNMGKAIAIGTGAGVLLGVIFGLALGNMAFMGAGIAIGISIGVAIGVGLNSSQTKDK